MVTDKDGFRLLQLGSDKSPFQTSILHKDYRVVVLACHQQMLGALYLNPSPKNIVIIGLGGGVLARSLALLLPESDITSVELDPLVVKVACDYFNFSESERQRVVVGDGRQFLESALQDGKSYDLIMLDAFDDRYIPTALMTVEFLQSVKLLLSNDGVLAANTFGLSALYDRESATYRAVFGNFFNVRHHNRVILFKDNGLPSVAVIAERAQVLKPHLALLGIDAEWLASLFNIAPDWSPLAKPLCDPPSPL